MISLEPFHDIDQLTQFIYKTPQDATLYFRRGLVRSSIKRLEDLRIAIDDYTRAITINAQYADAYLQRGKLKGILNDKKQAVEDIRIAAKIYFEMGNINKYDESMGFVRVLLT